jgi:hypothetical protein
LLSSFLLRQGGFEFGFLGFLFDLLDPGFSRRRFGAGFGGGTGFRDGRGGAGAATTAGD